MKWARLVALITAVVGWIYSWIVFRQVRSEHQLGDASLPGWLLILMGTASTVLIATAFLAYFRSWVWAPLALASGILFFSMIVLGQLSVMQSALDFARSQGAEARTVTFMDAARAALRLRSTAGAVVVAGVPTLLVLSGLTGLVLPNRVVADE